MKRILICSLLGAGLTASACATGSDDLSPRPRPDWDVRWRNPASFLDPPPPQPTATEDDFVTDGYICSVLRSPVYAWVTFVLSEQVECQGEKMTYTLQSAQNTDPNCSNASMHPDELRAEYRSLLDGLTHRLRYVVLAYDKLADGGACLNLGQYRQDKK